MNTLQYVFIVYAREETSYSYDGYEDILFGVYANEQAAKDQVQLLNRYITSSEKKAYYTTEPLIEE